MPIIFRDVCYSYTDKNPMDHLALSHLSFTIETGSFTALVGRTGCGKSTLVQQINALFHPLSGEVEVDGYLNSSDKKKRTKKNKELRKKVGLVFQFPEYQLFEESVLKDVVFGPKNFGASKEEALAAAKEALALVGLDESFYERSPFELSGGEKRRVAIAGILACHPEYLIVDEPTAGLDPIGRDGILTRIKEYQKSSGATVLLVSHSMEDVARVADRILVMDHSHAKMLDTVDNVFSHADELQAIGLNVPHITKVFMGLRARGFDVPDNVYTVDKAAQILTDLLKSKGGDRK